MGWSLSHRIFLRLQLYFQTVTKDFPRTTGFPVKRKLRIELAEICNVFSLKNTGVHGKINNAAAKFLVQESLPGSDVL